MEEAVSAAEENRKFSQLLRAVREWRSYVVTVLRWIFAPKKGNKQKSTHHRGRGEHGVFLGFSPCPLW